MSSSDPRKRISEQMELLIQQMHERPDGHKPGRRFVNEIEEMSSIKGLSVSDAVGYHQARWQFRQGFNQSEEHELSHLILALAGIPGYQGNMEMERYVGAIQVMLESRKKIDFESFFKEVMRWHDRYYSIAEQRRAIYSLVQQQKGGGENFTQEEMKAMELIPNDPFCNWGIAVLGGEYEINNTSVRIKPFKFLRSSEEGLGFRVWSVVEDKSVGNRKIFEAMNAKAWRMLSEDNTCVYCPDPDKGGTIKVRVNEGGKSVIKDLPLVGVPKGVAVYEKPTLDEAQFIYDRILPLMDAAIKVFDYGENRIELFEDLVKHAPMKKQQQKEHIGHESPVDATPPVADQRDMQLSAEHEHSVQHVAQGFRGLLQQLGEAIHHIPIPHKQPSQRHNGKGQRPTRNSP